MALARVGLGSSRGLGSALVWGWAGDRRLIAITANPDAISAIVPMEDAARMLGEWSETPAKFTKILVQVSE